MLQKSFFSVTVGRIVRPAASSSSFKYNRNRKNILNKPDAYDICIKAKAIARSAGASQALAYSLNQPPNLLKSSQPVLLNTVLTAFSAEGRRDQFWEVVGAKIDGKCNYENWSPELVATLLNQISIEMQHEKSNNSVSKSASDSSNKSPSKLDSLMQKATDIYIEALERLRDPSHLHIHNAYLKCISRSPSASYLLWIVDKITRGRLQDLDRKYFGIKEYLPVSESSLKLVKLFEKVKGPVELDSLSVVSILSTLSRSNESGSLIQLAETLWSKFQGINLNLNCHVALLLVYRNDLSRIFNTRKLIRSMSWRQRKLDRVLEIIKESRVDLSKDPKMLSIFFEICLNAKLKEKIGEFMTQNPTVRTAGDRRLLDLINRAACKH